MWQGSSVVGVLSGFKSMISAQSSAEIAAVNRLWMAGNFLKDG